MAIFKAFKPEGLAKIAKSMGYEGNLDNFSNFIEESPERQEKAIKMEQAAKMMAGGLIRMQEGGVAKPFTLAAKQVNGIGISVEDIPVHRVNDQVFYPGKPSTEEMTVTFDNVVKTLRELSSEKVVYMEKEEKIIRWYIH